MVQLQDLMHTEVSTITKEAAVLEAAERMSKKDISCLVVIENSTPVGIITRRDIFEKVMIQKENPEQIKVDDMMTKGVITFSPEATMLAASGVMKDKKIKQLPVVMDNNLVGIVTQTDVVHNVNKILKYDSSPVTLD